MVLVRLGAPALTLALMMFIAAPVRLGFGAARKRQLIGHAGDGNASRELTGGDGGSAFGKETENLDLLLLRIGGDAGTHEVASVSLEALLPEPSPPPLKSMAQVYTDAYNVLRRNNTCSQFFGGSATALEVLNRLTGQVRKAPLGNTLIGIRMSGKFVNVTNVRSGMSYRLFDQVVVNSLGPFYWPERLDQKSASRRVGSFPAFTREARVLMLLHELGHLIKGPDGDWLLPNDGMGSDTEQSARNSSLVETKCGDQIRALRRPGGPAEVEGFTQSGVERKRGAASGGPQRQGRGGYGRGQGGFGSLFFANQNGPNGTNQCGSGAVSCAFPIVTGPNFNDYSSGAVSGRVIQLRARSSSNSKQTRSKQETLAHNAMVVARVFATETAGRGLAPAPIQWTSGACFDPNRDT